MADASDDSQVGKVVGERYRLTQRLAAGGMGVVYRGERLQLGRPVAIKFLHPTFALRDDALRRFETEAKAMGRLAHPHCVSVMDFGVEEGMPYLVMEFVHGKTLRELLDAGTLRVGRALAIFRQLLAGVAHAHGQGIIHRDLKPANVMVTEATGTGDHVRILDFGLAKLRDSASGDASHGSLAIGTPSYMAPEQARGQPVDARSDVYSLGILLYELVTGEKPFFSDQAFEVLQMHASVPPPRLSERGPASGVSPELEAVVARALEKKPEDRFQTVAAFAEAAAATPEAQAAGWATSRSLGDADTQAGPRAASSLPRPPTGGPTRVPRPPSPPPPPLPPPRQATSVPPPIPPEVTPTPAVSKGHPAWTLAALLVFAGAIVLGWKFIESEKATARPDAGAVKKPPAPPKVATAVPAKPTTPPAPPRPAIPDAPPPRIPDAPPPPRIPDAPPPAIPDADDLDDDGDASVPPEEQHEPVAEVKPQPVREEEIDTVKPPPPPPAPVETRTVGDAESLIAAGKSSEAIAALERLREKNPKSAYIPYLLGNLYFERKWWTDGLESYRAAIRLNRAYHSRAILIRNAIQALSSGKTMARARALL